MKMNTYVSGSWQNIVFTEKFSVELFSTVWSVLISGSCLLRWLPMPNSTNCIFRESIYIFFKYVESRLFNFNAVTAYNGRVKIAFSKDNQLESFRFGYQYIIWKLVEVLRPFTHYVQYHFQCLQFKRKIRKSECIPQITV